MNHYQLKPIVVQIFCFIRKFFLISYKIKNNYRTTAEKKYVAKATRRRQRIRCSVGISDAIAACGTSNGVLCVFSLLYFPVLLPYRPAVLVRNP